MIKLGMDNQVTRKVIALVDLPRYHWAEDWTKQRTHAEEGDLIA